MPANLGNEILTESAPLAFEKSAMLCSEIPGTSGTCAWYHGVWQYFRLLGMVSSPHAQGAFFSKILQELAGQGRYGNLLISGTSDYAMLDIVRAAYASRDVPAKITVVDRCETPLYLNRWYAARFSLEVETEAANLLNYSHGQLFDVICTHSFLGNFTPRERPALVAKWRDLLRPGGKLVTVNRIRPGTVEPQTFSTERSRDFITRLLQAGERQANLGIAPARLEQWGREYAMRYRSYPVSSLDDFLSLFTTQGFKVERLALDGQYQDRNDPAPSTPGEALRVYLVVSRE